MKQTKRWYVVNKKADFNAISNKYKIDPVIARVMRNRDVITDEEIKEYLYGNENSLHNAKQMKDATKAVEILKAKIKEGKKIRIINDYDIDGVTSGYILLTGLRRCNANVSIYTPDRMNDGYGINMNIIDKAIEDEIDTIITCDNGISAINEIAYAKEHKITVIVTDHHSVPYEINEDGKKEYLHVSADAVVNPHQEDCLYPFDGLCGAGVAWKVVGLLYEACGIPKEEYYDLIEFAAFGTVGDIMDLKGENRTIVRLGLKKMHCTKNIGLRALIEENNLSPIDIQAYHIGFIIGPCVNATGRLELAKYALELFLEKDENKAREMAKHLVELNAKRKDMTLEGVEKAHAIIKEKGYEKDKVLVIYLPMVHESLAGIIAGRIREAYYKPVFVITDGEHCAKGSGRSIEEYSMFEEMNKCKELFEGFGGHPMAAGLSIKYENIETLRTKLNEITTLTEDDLTEKVKIDVPMPVSYISKDLVRQLSLLEPFGKGNTKPIFADKNIRINQTRVLGKNQNVLKMALCTESGCTMEGIYFGNIDEFFEYCNMHFGKEEVEKMQNGHPNNIRLSFIYEPKVNEFRGMESLQVNVSDYCI